MQGGWEGMGDTQATHLLQDGLYMTGRLETSKKLREVLSMTRSCLRPLPGSLARMPPPHQFLHPAASTATALDPPIRSASPLVHHSMQPAACRPRHSLAALTRCFVAAATPALPSGLRPAAQHLPHSKAPDVSGGPAPHQPMNT